MKRRIKIVVNSFTLFALILITLIYLFEGVIISSYYQIKYKSPIVTNNIKISFPEGFIYDLSDDHIILSHWEKNESYLYIDNIELSSTNIEELISFYKSKKFSIIDYQKNQFKGLDSFSISYLDDSWRYKKAIFVISRNVKVLYVGTRQDYDLYFSKIINNIEFIVQDK